jgi:hypothetical protein
VEANITVKLMTVPAKFRSVMVEIYLSKARFKIFSVCCKAHGDFTVMTFNDGS